VAAEQAFRKAIALDPAWVELAYRLGTALAAQGRLPEAATVFREVLAKEPSYPAAWNELAKCLDATDPAAAREARANAARYSRGAASATGGPAPSP
jgi:predicted Zn-dependent protease